MRVYSELTTFSKINAILKYKIFSFYMFTNEYISLKTTYDNWLIMRFIFAFEFTNIDLC